MSELMSQSPSSDSSVEYLEQAASGSLAAINALVQCALAAGETGEVSLFESAVAAGAYARLAAAAGGPDEQCTYGAVLRLIGEAYRASGQEGAAAQLAYESLRPLRSAADAGHEDAGKMLETTGAVWPAMSAETAALGEEVDDTLRRAASGCCLSLGAIVSGSLLNYTPETVPLQNLIEAEQYARLGAATGDLDLIFRLANVLMVRASLERATGGNRFLITAVEACELMIGLSQAGACDDAGLREFAAAMPAQVFQHVPDLLGFVTPKGSA